MNNCTCNKNDELRIVRGNAFSLRLTVRALRIDGTPVEDFDLSQANAVLKVEHLGTKTEKTFTVIDNDSVIGFDNTLALGWYGLEMTGSYNDAPWRWYVEKVFCIVETNAKANIPAWAILTDDTYIIDVNTSITSGDIYQSDWAETNPQSPSYIQNKPNVVTHEEYDPTIIAINKAISDEETRAKDAEKANADDIDGIEELIPAQATPQNQLADKQYVDDCISTATATYRGAYNLVSDLELTVAATEQQIAAALATKMTALGITPDNNDYCFVQVPTADATPTEIARVDRYKFNGTAWAFEFSLNNSGFTAAQWAALNSGITSGLVTKLSDLPTNSELTQLLNGKEDNSNKVTSLSAESTDTQYPSAKCVYDLHKANADDIDDIEALIPAQATPQNQLADKQYVDDGISTASATYRGAYNLVSDLELTVAATEQQIAAALATVMAAATPPIVPDNNDYCFVQVPTADATPTEIARVDRYKYNGTAWAFEFSLNNSGFTAAQWAALNSGITSGLVTKLSDLPTIAELTTLLNGKEDNSNKVTSLSAESTDTQYPSAKCVYDLHKANADDIDDIEALIPAQATPQNQLADKQYVDDGISTASATYRGAYNLVSDLELTTAATEQQIAAALATVMAAATPPIVPDNNDYCFVQVPTADATPTEIARVDRYKFNGTAWAFEFSLNNSGFTAEQWAALNSGITSGLVTKLSDLPTNSELTTLLGGKEDKSNKVTSLSAESTDTQYPSAKCVYDLHKANADDIDAIEEKIPSGASSSNKMATASDITNLSDSIAAILLLIPSAASSLNQLADKAFVNSSIATNTATYRGSYNLVSDLSLTISATEQQIAAALATKMTALSITPENNDYCFVQVPTDDATPTEISRIDRYKYNGTAWLYEYSLNNSSFTSAQWAAINSGITSALVAKLSALPTNAELTTALGVLTDGIAAINAKIPSDATSSNKLVDNTAMQSYVAQIVNALDATFNITSSDGHVTVQITQTNGVITALAITTSDIASAAALNLLSGRVTTAEGNISTNATDIANLQQLYNNLQQSDPIIIEPTDTWPVANPSTHDIYRVIDRVNTPPQYYSDYMWNGTTMVLMAQYDNAIDDEPTPGSNNLVKSGGVAANIVYDISRAHASGSTLATYADLAAALGTNGANVPASIRRGGMSVKFVQSSDNKYVQYRLMSDSFNIIPRNWQGVDNKPIGGSKNLVESGGAFKWNQYYILPLYQGIPQNPSMLNRVQTEYIKVRTGFKISVTAGYYVYTVYKYNPETFVQIQDLTINDTEWTSDGDYLIKVIFKNGFAGTDSLSPNDEIIKEVNDLFSILSSSTKGEQNIKIASVRSILKLQNSALNISTGETGNPSEIRVCTGYLKPPFKLVLNNGYLVYDIYKYNEDYTYKGRSSIVTANNQVVELSASSPYEIVRMTIKKGLAGTDTLSNQDDLIFDYTGSAAAEESEVGQEKAKIASLSNSTNTNIINIDLNSLIIEDGAINIAGQDSDASNRLRTKDYIYGTKKITLPAGFMIYMVLYYNSETLAFDSYVDVTDSTYTIGKSNCVARFSICKTDRTQPVTVSELKQVLSLELLNKEIKDINNTVKSLAPQPTAIRFDIDHNVKDFSDILSHVTITPTTGMMERVYALFDQLVALYPDYVSKFDPMASSDTTQTVTVDGVDHTITVNAMSDIKTAMAGAGFNDYPVYAKGITETVSETITNVDGTTYTVEYTSTPAYKTYMYKFACERPYINTDINKKEKVFLLSNTHGNEVSAPLNLYLFMKQLCDGVINDGNFYKFRAAFDFYVVPHLNGYGCYHSTRCNARRVDLNRNFPISAWYIAGKNTIDDDNLCEFTGPNAGSEFETQLVVNLVEAINPVFACDLHNHGDGTCQLYSGLINKDGLLFTKLAQQASVDMAIAFGKNYPEYFGTGYHDILFGATADAPGHNANLNLPHTYCWWNEYGVKFPCLIEIGTKIDWRNGEQEARVDTWFSADFFSIAEYTLRIQLIRYFQYLLDNKNYL